MATTRRVFTLPCRLVEYRQTVRVLHLELSPALATGSRLSSPRPGFLSSSPLSPLIGRVCVSTGLSLAGARHSFPGQLRPAAGQSSSGYKSGEYWERSQHIQRDVQIYSNIKSRFGLGNFNFSESFVWCTIVWSQSWSIWLVSRPRSAAPLPIFKLSTRTLSLLSAPPPTFPQSESEKWGQAGGKARIRTQVWLRLFLEETFINKDSKNREREAYITKFKMSTIHIFCTFHWMDLSEC